MSSHPIRVVVCDDSAVVRGLLARAIESDPNLQLVGTAMHGEAALSTLRRIPADVVVLDVEMPVMDGLTALQRIQQEFPRIRVIMASALTSEGADTTLRALSLGAVGCIAKPTSSSVNESITHLTKELLPQIRALGRSDRSATATAHTSPAAESRGAHRSREAQHPFTAVVIGTSTGGPQALRKVLCDLPSDFPLPIFIVQHMPPLFTPMLAKHIQMDTGRPSQEAKHLENVKPGHTYVAPGDYHMELERRDGNVRTLLTQAAPEHYCRPSVNPLFRTAAQVYRQSLLSVVLTGMGEDGKEGAADIVKNGGWLIAQDEASSVVWGMPGAVVRAKLAHEVLPLDQVGPRILQACLELA